MEKTKHKFNPIKLIVLCISLLVLSFSLSYAYFTVGVNYTSTAEERKQTVNTATLDIDFITSEYINNNSIQLIKAEEVETLSEKSIFNIKNIDGATYDSKYNISLKELTISDNFKSQDFKWSLVKNNEEIATGNFSSANSGEDILLTSSPIVLLSNETHNYELRIWLQETDLDQSSLYDGIFQAKVSIDLVVGK